MSKVVLITGSSTGIGKETAKYFASRDWNVVATMRSPEKCPKELLDAKNVDVARVDVLDIDSIRDAIKCAVKKHGRIDVIVNNAGYSLSGELESSTREQIERQIKTNLTGLIAMTKEIIPIFRSQGGGMIINLSSVGGRVAIPRFSVYAATKWGVEGFSESLYNELRPYNIAVKIIEPGFIETDFYRRSMDVAGSDRSAGLYAERSARTRTGSPPIVVARTIFKAASSQSRRLRYGSGKMSTTALLLRRLLPEALFLPLVSRMSRRM